MNEFTDESSVQQEEEESQPIHHLQGFVWSRQEKNHPNFQAPASHCSEPWKTASASTFQRLGAGAGPLSLLPKGYWVGGVELPTYGADGGDCTCRDPLAPAATAPLSCPGLPCTTFTRSPPSINRARHTPSNVESCRGSGTGRGLHATVVADSRNKWRTYESGSWQAVETCVACLDVRVLVRFLGSETMSRDETVLDGHQLHSYSCSLSQTSPMSRRKRPSGCPNYTRPCTNTVAAWRVRQCCCGYTGVECWGEAARGPRDSVTTTRMAHDNGFQISTSSAVER
jgi:hypothetical protein